MDGDGKRKPEVDINVKPAECFKRWLEFKVIAEGSNHQVFVDGKKLYNEKHNAFKNGKFVRAMILNLKYLLI